MPNIDNAVVSGLLCYISTARNSYNEQTILSVCQSFYSHDKIVEAKKILFTITNEPLIVRRGDFKCKTDLNDIINRIRDADEKNEVLPTFVADTYSGMLPVSGYEPFAEHLIHLMEELSGMKEEIKLLRDSRIGDNPQQDMLDVKEDLHDIKNMLLKFSNNKAPRTSEEQRIFYSDVLNNKSQGNSFSKSKFPSDRGAGISEFKSVSGERGLSTGSG